jgi:hypothetical protein
MNIQEWIESVAGTTLRQVALATEIPVPTLARQVREQAVTPETVVRIARKYDASPLGGFVAIGLITDTEANAMSVAEALGRATDLELATEAVRRIEAGIAGGAITDEADSVVATLPTVAEKRAAKRTYPKPATEAARGKGKK